MKKLEKIMALFNEVGIEYEKLTDNEISIPTVCDINNVKKTGKNSCDYTAEEWLNNENSTVLCDDCESFAIKIYESEKGLSIFGMIDKDNIYIKED